MLERFADASDHGAARRRRVSPPRGGPGTARVRRPSARADARHRGVRLEPTTVVAKAWEHVERIGRRSSWAPTRVLVTGAGPIGLLAALLGVQRGLDVHVYDRISDGAKPRLAAALGATYHHADLAE